MKFTTLKEFIDFRKNCLACGSTTTVEFGGAETILRENEIEFSFTSSYKSKNNIVVSLSTNDIVKGGYFLNAERGFDFCLKLVCPNRCINVLGYFEPNNLSNYTEWHKKLKPIINYEETIFLNDQSLTITDYNFYSYKDDNYFKFEIKDRRVVDFPSLMQKANLFHNLS